MNLPGWILKWRGSVPDRGVYLKKKEKWSKWMVLTGDCYRTLCSPNFPALLLECARRGVANWITHHLGLYKTIEDIL